MTEEAEKARIPVHLIIGYEDNIILEATAFVTEKKLDEILTQFGLGEPYEPPKAVGLYRPIQVNCQYRNECTDYPEKCGDCKWNSVKSYYMPKETPKESP